MVKKQRQDSQFPNPPQKRHVFLISLLTVVFFVLAVSAIYWSMTQHSPEVASIKIDGLYIAKPTDVANFRLVDNTGKAFTKDNLKGHWTFLFFGFTNCGMVCPTTLAELNKMVQTLQKDLPDNQVPQVVMVSVDPERDDVQRLNDYVKTFNPRFVGARGDNAETEALKAQFHIVSGKMRIDGGKNNQYTINHSAEIMVINPEGKLQAYLSYPHKADQMAGDYRLILSNTKA